MAVPEVYRTSNYPTDGATTVFQGGSGFVVPEPEAGDDYTLGVILTTTSSGVETQLAEGTSSGEYSVSRTAATGEFSITTVDTYAAGFTITIIRDEEFSQERQFRNQGPSFAATQTAAYDHGTEMTQQLKEKLDRALVVGVASSVDPDDLVALIEALGSLSPLTLADDSFFLTGSSDPTKIMAFEVDTLLTTLTTRTYTVPDVDGTMLVVASLGAGEIPFGDGTGTVARDPNLFWNATTDKLGIGTTTPGNTGMAKVEILGADSDTDGPHLQLLSDIDAYPTMQLMNWTHDNLGFGWDCYSTDGSTWTSSDAGSNAYFSKTGDAFSLFFDSGVAAGNSLSADTVMTVDDQTTRFHINTEQRAFQISTFTEVNMFYITPTGKIGFDTSTPGANGCAQYEIGGANTSCDDGPCVQFMTQSSSYPQIQIFPYDHDRIEFNMDAYFDDTNWRSSDLGSNFAVHKFGDELLFRYNNGTAQGATFSWSNALVIDATGAASFLQSIGVTGNITSSTGDITALAGDIISNGGILAAASVSIAPRVQLSNNSGIATMSMPLSALGVDLDQELTVPSISVTTSFTGAAFLDDDTMATATSTTAASSESIKAYADSVVGAAGALCTASFMHVEDQKASGTAGGASATTTWTGRDLNTSVANTIAGASVAANQIVLPAGTYWCTYSAPCHSAAVTLSDPHQLRVRQVSGAPTTLAVGSSCRVNQSLNTDNQNQAVGSGFFTLAGSETIELQHYITVGRAADGLGVAVNSGEVEVYAAITIWEV